VGLRSRSPSSSPSTTQITAAGLDPRRRRPTSTFSTVPCIGTDTEIAAPRPPRTEASRSAASARSSIQGRLGLEARDVVAAPRPTSTAVVRGRRRPFARAGCRHGSRGLAPPGHAAAHRTRPSAVGRCRRD
jgi:hypothetical protein